MEKESTTFHQELCNAIRRDEFYLTYQPKCELSTGKIIGVEALVRWQHPVKGIITPDLFIPYAESSGLISIMSWRILQLAMHQLTIWHELGRHYKISVNLSPGCLHYPGFLKTFEEIIEAYPVTNDHLTLELTETTEIHDIDQSKKLLYKIRDLGINLSLDDFGTGTSSLTKLYMLPFTELKIDRMFVSNLTTEPTAREIVFSSIELAKKIKLTSVAEGIETLDQYSRLREFGCDYGQGYFIAKPMTAKNFDSWSHNYCPHP